MPKQKTMSVHERIARGYTAEPESRAAIAKRSHKKYYSTAHGKAVRKAWGQTMVAVGDREYSKRYLTRRNTALKKNYGITLETYEALSEKQRGLCAVCQNPPTRRRLDVDHCHKTGVVRGLLCGSCNRALGQLKDDVKRVVALAEYLQRGQDKGF